VRIDANIDHCHSSQTFILALIDHNSMESAIKRLIFAYKMPRG